MVEEQLKIIYAKIKTRDPKTTSSRLVKAW